MDLENAKVWISQPDVCRCCLAARGSWNLTASHQNNGVKEVFSEMLLDTLGISLSHLEEWGPSRMVCGRCTEQLRNAQIFKQQVLDVEQMFCQHFEKDALNEDRNPIKTEIEEEYFEDATSVSIDFPSVTKEHKKQSFIRKKQHQTKLKDHKIKTIVENCEENLSKSEEGLKTKFINFLANIKPAAQKPEKPLSERKRIILTCQNVLTLTTACPFRHHRSWFACLYCKHEFTDMRTLRLHLNTHSDVKNEIKNLKNYPKSLQIDISHFKCRLCDIVLLNVDHMFSHLLEIHKKIIFKEYIADYKVDVSPYKCHLCGKEFHVFRNLTTHLNVHYANCVCEECGKGFINSKRLKVHKRTHQTGEFHCKECEKILPTKTALSNHMESHSKRLLKCNICSQTMKHYNDRIKHMSEVHNVTHVFKCALCPKEYNIKHYLATHVRQTHGNKDKKCNICHMAFITNHGLKKHMTKHEGVKPYACHLCTKVYARNYTLKEHLKAHEACAK